MAKKVNPRRRPATFADVDKAWEKGVLDGCSNASAMFLTILCDKFDMSVEEVQRFWKEVNKLSEEVAEQRVSIADLRTVLLEEYKIKV